MAKMKRESEHAICQDVQSSITIEKNIYFFFFLDKSMKCCTLGKHSTYGQESLHSLGTGKQFPNSQLLSVAGYSKAHSVIVCLKAATHPYISGPWEISLKFFSPVCFVDSSRKKKKEGTLQIYIFFVLVRRLGCFNFRPRFYHCQGDLRQRLGQWAGNWWPWRMGRAILSTTEYK